MQNSVDGLLKDDYNLTHLIMQSPVAMALIYGENHVLQIINKKALELLGHDWKSVNNRPLFEAIPELKNQGLESIIHAVFTSGDSFCASELALTMSYNGKPQQRFLDVTFQALRDDQHKVIGIVATGVDITERKKIADLQEAYAEELKTMVAQRTLELQQSNEDLQQFAHIASHDLKEPVRKITSYSDMILNHDLTEEVKQDFIKNINKSGKRMAKTIEDILKYSTSDQHFNDDFEDIELNETIAGIRVDLEMTIKEKMAVITTEHLPVIRGSRILIYQLFYNLVANALKFSKPQVESRINISAKVVYKDNKGFAVISVADNGVGFDQQYAEKIFEKFSRLHSKDKFEGTGLGLALCRKIVNRHMGTIEAKGIIDEGSTFIISLPV